jgi:hypothetical protein
MAKTGRWPPKMGPKAAAMGYVLPALTGILLTPIHLSGIISFQTMMIIVLLSFLPMPFLSRRYWRMIDEPSREAHKFAFFWGGGSGAGIVLLIGIALMFFPGPRDLVQGWIEGFIAVTKGAFGKQQGAVGVCLAIMIGTMLQCLAYLLVWIGWWARQRIGTTSD